MPFSFLSCLYTTQLTPGSHEAGANLLDINSLIDLTKTKQRQCDAKAWRFRFQGTEIILRDVAEKTVHWLTKFKDFGDIAVNYDPVHSSIPWAGVRIILQVCQICNSPTVSAKHC